MFEVIYAYMTHFIDLLPSIIGLYILFDFMGSLLPNNRW